MRSLVAINGQAASLRGERAWKEEVSIIGGGQKMTPTQPNPAEDRNVSKMDGGGSYCWQHSGLSGKGGGEVRIIVEKGGGNMRGAYPPRGGNDRDSVL